MSVLSWDRALGLLRTWLGERQVTRTGTDRDTGGKGVLWVQAALVKNERNECSLLQPRNIDPIAGRPVFNFVDEFSVTRCTCVRRRSDGLPVHPVPPELSFGQRIEVKG